MTSNLNFFRLRISEPKKRKTEEAETHAHGYATQFYKLELNTFIAADLIISHINIIPYGCVCGIANYELSKYAR